MTYRSRFEVASDVLNVALEGKASRRKLMRVSVFSSAQISEYLGFLLTSELITMDKDKRFFALTEKGTHFLNLYKDLRTLIPLDEQAPFPS